MMMMPQPVMMAQPMMMQAPAPQAPIIINQKNDNGDCPSCKKGNMVSAKACTCWTCIVAVCCVCGLCCDCAWGTKRKCLSCGFEVKL